MAFGGLVYLVVLIPLRLWCFDLLLDCALFGLGCGDFCDLVLGLPVWGVVLGLRMWISGLGWFAISLLV